MKRVLILVAALLFAPPAEAADIVGKSAVKTVTIGDVTFDWEPQTPAGVEMTMSGRGTDIRLEQTDRVGADERKIARRERRRPGGDE